jgi:hypothetical protein
VSDAAIKAMEMAERAFAQRDALAKALTDLCDEIAAEETHGDGADDAGCQTCRAHKRARKLLRSLKQPVTPAGRGGK